MIARWEHAAGETLRTFVVNRDGRLTRPKRLPSNLFPFRAGTG